MRWNEPGRRPPGQIAGVFLAALMPLSAVWVSTPPDPQRPATYLYYLAGNRVGRLSLPGMRSETLITLNGEEASIGPDSIRAAAGTIAWLSRGREPGTLRIWDGSRRRAIQLDRLVSGSAGAEVEHDSVGNVRGYVPITEPTYLTDFLLSPDGLRLAWSANLVTAISPESSGTAHRRHLVFAAATDGGNNRLVLDQAFRVPYYLADNDEQRRLIAWSEVDLDRILFTREMRYQMYGGFQGLHACDLRTGQARPIAPGVAQVLAVSADEEWLVDTPTDETCCAGVNYTDNLVTLHHLPTGRRTVLLDEWKEFGNTPKDTDEHGQGVEYVPTYAHFSRDGERVAFTMQRWEENDPAPPRVSEVAFVHETRTGRRIARIPRRLPLGWQDGKHLVLCAQRFDRFGVGTPDSLFIYDVVTGRQTRLPLVGIRPIAVGP